MPNPNVGFFVRPIGASAANAAMLQEQMRQRDVWRSSFPGPMFPTLQRPCRCAYCASIVKGDRCDSCGAPR